MIKKIAVLSIILLFAWFIFSLSKQIYESLHVGNRVEQEEADLAKLKEKNISLKKKFSETETIRFIEGQARDKLNLARPEETIVIIPEEAIEKVLASEQEQKVLPEPNWQGWLRLFWK